MLVSRALKRKISSTGQMKSNDVGEQFNSFDVESEMDRRFVVRYVPKLDMCLVHGRKPCRECYIALRNRHERLALSLVLGNALFFSILIQR